MSTEDTTYKLPEGWILTTLPELFVIIGGGTPSKNNISFWNGDINWASVKDIKSKYLDETIDKISKEGLEYSSTNIANKGDIVLVTRISPGETAIVKTPTAVNQDLKILKIFGSIPDEFVYHLLCYNKNKFIKHSSGTTVKGLKINDLNDIKLPLPPLAEQHRIIAKIEELFSELDYAKAGLIKAEKHLEVYRQSLLKSAFDGNLTKNLRRNDFESAKILLEQIRKKRTEQDEIEIRKWHVKLMDWERMGKNGKRPSKPTLSQKQMSLSKAEFEKLKRLPENWEWDKLGNFSFVTKLAGFEFSKYIIYSTNGEIPVIKAQNVGKAWFKPGNYSFIDNETLEKLPRIAMHGGEILFVFIGAGIGNVGIVPNDRKYLLGPNVAMIKPVLEISNKYLLYFLSSLLGKEHILALTKATAQGSVSMENIRKIYIPVAPQKEQDQIVQELESRFTILENLKDAIKIGLKKIEVYRHSVLKSAFAGKLISQDSADEPASLLLKKIQTEKGIYFRLQREENKLKPKRMQIMKNNKTVLRLLQEADGPISAKELWQQSIHIDDIEGFYAELKEIYYKIKEVKQNTESFLSIIK